MTVILLLIVYVIGFVPAYIIGAIRSVKYKAKSLNDLHQKKLQLEDKLKKARQYDYRFVFRTEDELEDIKTSIARHTNDVPEVPVDEYTIPILAFMFLWPYLFWKYCIDRIWDFITFPFIYSYRAITGGAKITSNVFLSFHNLFIQKIERLYVKPPVIEVNIEAGNQPYREIKTSNDV